MPAIVAFHLSVLQGICDVLGDASNGLTHKEISKLLSRHSISEREGTNKVQRLYNALSYRQQLDSCGNIIVAVLNGVMHPAAYTHAKDHFEQRRERLNKVLALQDSRYD